MNLILLQAGEPLDFLASGDFRYKHIKGVLRAGLYDTVYLGVAGGKRGLATIVKDSAEGLYFETTWEAELFPLLPIDVFVGLPRPQTVKKVIMDCVSIGVRSLSFFVADKTDPGYAQSKLWTQGEWKKVYDEALQQAFVTTGPEIRLIDDLSVVFEDDVLANRQKLVLDNYEASSSLWEVDLRETLELALFVGCEGGFSPNERKLFVEKGCVLAGLGERVLRVEAACLFGLGIIRGKLGR